MIRDNIQGHPGAPDSRHVRELAPFTVTVDRRGDIYKASIYDANPDSGGLLLASEWLQFGTPTARRVEPDAITTRSAVSCTEAAGACAEMRMTSRAAEVEPAASEIFTRYRGTSPDDPRIAPVAEIGSISEDASAREPASTGPITDALAAWQRRPPAAGSTHELFVHQEERQFTTGMDGSDGNEEEVTETRTVTLKLWVDSATHLPLKEEVSIADELVSLRYFSYASGRLTASELSSDFFAVSRPDRVEQEKTVEYDDEGSVGSQSDPATGTRFQPYYFGASALIAARLLCLQGEAVERLSEPSADSITNPSDELVPDPLAEHVLRVTAYYGELGPDGLCRELADGAPTLTVRSAATDSTLAQAWRRSYAAIGERVEADPLGEDYLRAGVMPIVSLDPEFSATAYVATLDDVNVGVYLERGPTAIVVTGPFAKTHVNEIISKLEAQ